MVFVLAFLSDVFDGVIARRLNVVTKNLRVFDSYADITMYICLMAAILIIFRGRIRFLVIPFVIVFAFQVLNWSVSAVKFRRLTSYHSYMAKLRGVVLFISVALLFVADEPRVFWLSIAFAIVSNIEGTIISFILPQWNYDVWSIPNALRLRAEFVEGREQRT